MIELTEQAHPGSCIVSESEGPFHTRDEITVALSQTLTPNMVLGRNEVVADVTSSAAADAGNTGNGTLTLDATTPVLEGAKDGRYRAVCIEEAAGGGQFEVFDPAGASVGPVAVGGTFATEIKFALAAGATDFKAGDSFNIDIGIELGDYEWFQLDPSNAGEAAKAKGICIYGVTTDATTKQTTSGLVRGPCEVRLTDLIWPDGITVVQKAAALRQLEEIGIVGR